jgi:hypothetical protein
MRFGSVCSGIEAASVAFAPLGWKAAWLAEIEAFPSAVLAHHYPAITNLGDMTLIADRIDAGEVEAPDLLCGGCPCQSFSVAGLRQSLSDQRGNLTLEFIRIADAIDRIRRRDGKHPAWVLYENVPGILNTKDNAFGAFLGGLCGGDTALDPPADGWPSAGVVAGPGRVVAWRCLDAQFFGLAQRRKRVFVLALGGPRRWTCADALLPIIDSLSGHPAPSRKTRQGTSAVTAPSLTASGRGVERTGESRGQDPVIAVCASEPNSVVPDQTPLAPHGEQQARSVRVPPLHCAEIAPTLNAAFGSKLGLEDQHIRGGGGLFVAGHIPMHHDRNGTAVRPGDGDADSYHRGRLRCRSRAGSFRNSRCAFKSRGRPNQQPRPQRGRRIDRHTFAAR